MIVIYKLRILIIMYIEILVALVAITSFFVGLILGIDIGRKSEWKDSSQKNS